MMAFEEVLQQVCGASVCVASSASTPVRERGVICRPARVSAGICRVQEPALAVVAARQLVYRASVCVASSASTPARERSVICWPARVSAGIRRVQEPAMELMAARQQEKVARVAARRRARGWSVICCPDCVSVGTWADDDVLRAGTLREHLHVELE